MSQATHRQLPDEQHRDAAVASRGENLLVDAGAGTGKTTLLVRRLVGMVAPPDDAATAIPLDRIAAVTFTRKAAGELRLRVREKLLSELAARPSPTRRDRLVAALAAADTAFIGTIHGFADRLLRRHPVEARLSPSYQVLEDTSALFRETFETLLHAAEAGTLAGELRDAGIDPAVAEEAGEAVRLALEAEVQVETREHEFHSSHGLDALFAAFIEHRDVPPVQAPAPPFPADAVKQAIEDFLGVARQSRGGGTGARFLARFADRLEALAGEPDPVTLFREVNAALRWKPRKMRLRDEFAGDRTGFDAWKAWTGFEQSQQKQKVWITGAEERVLGPAQRWLATRLVRAFPVVVALYGKVKARHRSVDQVDLLLLLRDLLASNLEIRGEMQRRFDHVFVDEFQDTDPLQAEIILYLCEARPLATRWQDVELAPGRLTLVGDPKQSIYRFRRADISVYESVRAIVARGKHRHVPLTANFRSLPALVHHLNDRYDEILGRPAAGTPDFDVAAGTVVNRRLEAAREGGPSRCVAVLPYRSDQGKAADDRALEATVLATYLRALAARGRDLGDVAVLAHSTFHVPLLTAELDRMGVPWTARGGSLFLEDPLHRQFLLGLRAIADRDDGVALMALSRAPFFAVDMADLVRAGAAPGETDDEGIRRARAAREQVLELRRRRFERPPGETARDLLERTGLGRAVAFGPNGRQRLERLHELCLELERVAAAGGLDYDAATARLRAWVDDPAGIDPPRPVGGGAVQIMTIHQAKGLEFPVVVWWDGRAAMAPRKHQVPWHVSREDGAWAIDIAGVAWEEPRGRDLLAREQAYVAAERRRLVYVAGTRARDLLVLPAPAGGGDGFVTHALIGVSSPALDVHDEWMEGEPPAWANGIGEPAPRQPREAAALAASVAAGWAAAAAESGRPRFEPRGISTEAHARVEARFEDEAGARWTERQSRFGNVFGHTVHLAIGAALREPGRAAGEAVARAARSTGLDAHLAEAAEDVARALAALEREGLRRAPGPDLRLEYPVATAEGGMLLQGYVDLLAVRHGSVAVVDFKTDAPPGGSVGEVYPAYVEQVRAYGQVLVKLGIARAGDVRCGLLFTGDGLVRWV